MAIEESEAGTSASPPFSLTAATSTPALTRTNSWASSGAGAGSAFNDDADLIGAPVDADGNVLEYGQADPTSALTDLLHTFWHPPKFDLDILDRKLKQASEHVRQRVAQRRAQGGSADGTRAPLTSIPREAAREELRRMRANVALRVDKLSARWAEQKTVRLRDKISFVVGVMNLILSSLLFAFAPEKVFLSYSIQSAFVLPIRVYTYYRLHWHYFLFDYCYFANLLNLAYLWLFPENKFLFLVCYCSSQGPLAFSIATWRNSAVFHSLEKMTSLFIHLYPVITFCALRHYMPIDLRDKRFPAISQLPELNSWTALKWNVTFYFAWQLTYYLFISRSKADKIASGERINSYSTLSKGKGAVAKVLAKAPMERREWAFIALQFVYTIVCTLPAPLVFYNSRRASSVFCLLLILLSVWNGAGYYVEVWGRRFERELAKLRSEVEATQQKANAVHAANAANTSDQGEQDNSGSINDEHGTQRMDKGESEGKKNQ